VKTTLRTGSSRRSRPAFVATSFLRCPSRCPQANTTTAPRRPPFTPRWPSGSHPAIALRAAVAEASRRRSRFRTGTRSPTTDLLGGGGAASRHSGIRSPRWTSSWPRHNRTPSRKGRKGKSSSLCGLSGPCVPTGRLVDTLRPSAETRLYSSALLAGDGLEAIRSPRG
jgi:hypothetical protein